MRILGYGLSATLILCMVFASTNVVYGRIERHDLGRSVKLTILIDKVMQPQAEWVTEEWMIKEAAEAGFNVFSPRRGYDRLDEVDQVTRWCEKYGIYHMPWMRGTLNAPDGSEAHGKRIVWASGNEQALWSPNSDEFWEWTNRYIIEYAKMSARNEHLMGVFLDYENYAPGKEGNLYSLSYDDIIMGKFAESKGIELPKLALEKRNGWLEEAGLHDEFSEFQINHWRERCRFLRKAVDEYDPKFQFCIYPAPGTPFMVKATYPEWATQEAPLILADPSTYGRPGRFMPQASALKANREKLLKRMQTAKDAGIPFMYAGGIDPVVRGADPEFSGKNAVAISDVTDGYWIFYEGPTYTKQDHADYWKWFSWANTAISKGDFAVQYEPRETEENWHFDMFKSFDSPDLLTAGGATGTIKYPIVKMRHDNMMLIAGKAGQPVEIVLQNHPIAHYESFLVWKLTDIKMVEVASGNIPHGKSGTVNFTPESDGIYVLGASAGQCAYSVVSSNAPVGMYTGDGLSTISGADRLYFKVPAGLEQFSITGKGYGGETVRVNIFDPTGSQIATGQTTLKQGSVKIEVSAGKSAGEIWSLELTKADEGVLEDVSIRLDSKLPAVLSLSPEHVFGIREKAK